MEGATGGGGGKGPLPASVAEPLSEVAAMFDDVLELAFADPDETTDPVFDRRLDQMADRFADRIHELYDATEPLRPRVSSRQLRKARKRAEADGSAPACGMPPPWREGDEDVFLGLLAAGPDLTDTRQNVLRFFAEAVVDEVHWLDGLGYDAHVWR